jgi:hypothetical protein
LRRIAVPVLVVALLVGTTAAFAVTEALKLERSPITRPRFDEIFSPTCRCATRTAQLSIKLRKGETIDAVVVDEDGEPVRALAENSHYEPGRIVFRWNGKDDAGHLVPDGSYRLRMHFDAERRTIVIPNVVTVDTKAPSIQLLSVTPTELSAAPGQETAQLVFRVSESARPLLLLDGALALRGKLRQPGTHTLLWTPAAPDGRALKRGRYVLTLQAQDPAGNLSLPTQGVEIVVRAAR